MYVLHELDLAKHQVKMLHACYKRTCDAWNKFAQNGARQKTLYTRRINVFPMEGMSVLHEINCAEHKVKMIYACYKRTRVALRVFERIQPHRKHDIHVKWANHCGFVGTVGTVVETIAKRVGTVGTVIIIIKELTIYLSSMIHTVPTVPTRFSMVSTPVPTVPMLDTMFSGTHHGHDAYISC